MNLARTTFTRLNETSTGRLFIVLALFALCRLLSLLVFYEGFLHIFNAVNFRLFGAHAPALLSRVPYHDASIILSSLLNPYFLLALVLFYVPFFVKRKALRDKTFTYTAPERLFIFTAAFLLAWELSTYQFNYYLNQPFYFDRIALIILAFLLLRFPLLTPLFVAFAYVYRSQFNYPVDGFTLHDKRLLFDLLIMFVVHVYARLYLPLLKIPYAFFLILVLASGYFTGGLSKLTISPHGYEWLLQNDPVNLFHNICYRGWLAQATESTRHMLESFFTHYGKLFQALAFLIELSALFILYSRRAGIIIIVGLLAMHTGIFCMTGFLFWKWMAVDLVLLFCYIYKRGYYVNELFQKSYFKTSVLIMFVSFAWLQPIKFGWHDTPANQFFTYEVENAKGEIYSFEKNEMNPYHQWFQLDRFLFLVNKPTLPLSGFGYTAKYAIAKGIVISGPKKFLQFENANGKDSYQADLKNKYEEFIRTYFTNRNARLNETFLPSAFMAPFHLYNSETGNVWHEQQPVHTFRVIFNQVYTVNGKPLQITRQVVDEVVIE
ncbi:MAG: hypothetical protein JWO09_3664 [Bacteroidetes bacterium]|nr:hypothetical protein [Bacteroidota bacterium]